MKYLFLMCFKFFSFMNVFLNIMLILTYVGGNPDREGGQILSVVLATVQDLLGRIRVSTTQGVLSFSH